MNGKESFLKTVVCLCVTGLLIFAGTCVQECGERKSDNYKACIDAGHSPGECTNSVQSLQP